MEALFGRGQILPCESRSPIDKGSKNNSDRVVFPARESNPLPVVGVHFCLGDKTIIVTDQIPIIMYNSVDFNSSFRYEDFKRIINRRDRHDQTW